ncbi:MAG: AmmeMemoRadiSam system protein B [Bacteroidetes bacterium]|nr:AmmeMemoRadiSam system protein B [Bacteroidota bacterium]
MIVRNTMMLIIISIAFLACKPVNRETNNLRYPVDTIGFAHLDYQMDSIMERLTRNHEQNPETFLDMPKVVISPHDDYAFVGNLYPETLKNIRATTVFLFGVAHKARLLGLEDQLIFDSYDCWKGPYGDVKVSEIRDMLKQQLPPGLFVVNDSMHQMEHSLEALIPFLQFYNRDVQIIPVLVPYMSYNRMEDIAKPLSEAIRSVLVDKGLEWGKDFAFVISTDAVHYGDEDWGGKNFAVYGTDSAGYARTLAHEKMIMDTLSGNLSPRKIKAFCEFTVDENNYHEYKWTWCGRYSVPLGLLTVFELNEATGNKPLAGTIIGYSNSINHPVLKVDDLGMGTTAPANTHHWVGYASIAYK